MKFSINIKPKGKGRPRFAKRENFVQTYTPTTTREYEETIRNAFIEQLSNKINKEYVGPIKVDICAFFEPPRSYSKKLRIELLETAHLKKPDADNIAKSILDALNGVAWNDDCQISELKVHKYYAEEDRIIVEIKYGENDE